MRKGFMKQQYLTIEEQFKKTLNDDEINRIQDHELREIRRKHWEYRMKIFRDESNISDTEFCRLSDADYEKEEKEIEEYRKKRGIQYTWILSELGRRNLSPIQRIAIAEKYRSLYEKQAKENLRQASGGDRRSEKFEQNQGLPNSVKVENRIDTTKKLADVAGVGKETYRMGAKILNSDNEEVKNAVLSGEMSINAGYNKLRENKKQNLKIHFTVTLRLTSDTILNVYTYYDII